MWKNIALAILAVVLLAFTLRLQQNNKELQLSFEATARRGVSFPQPAKSDEISGAQGRPKMSAASSASAHRQGSAVTEHRRKYIESVKSLKRRIEWDSDTNTYELVDSYASLCGELGLSQDKLADLKKLLYERSKSVDDAADIAARSKESLSSTGLAMRFTKESIDGEIQRLVGATVFAQIKVLDDNLIELGRVKATYGPEMAFDGVPLTARQSVDLAKTLSSMENIGISELDTTSRRKYYTRDIDLSTNLSSTDRITLQQASTFLSPQQLSIFSNHLAAVTSQYVALLLQANASRSK